MKRTKLLDRELPNYTKCEEIINMTTHIIGAVFGIVALVTTIIVSVIHHDGFALASSIVYGVSMILLYTMSSIYHGLSPNFKKAKRIFQIMDHCSIFILIAGTYTPVLLCAIRQISLFWAWLLFGIVWGVCVIGIVLNSIDIKMFGKLSMFLYLALGWCIIIKINYLPETIGMKGVLLIALGGIAYTIGTIFYKLGKKIVYMHSIWHVMILLGTILQYLAIIKYVI